MHIFIEIIQLLKTFVFSFADPKEDFVEDSNDFDIFDSNGFCDSDSSDDFKPLTGNTKSNGLNQCASSNNVYDKMANNGQPNEKSLDLHSKPMSAPTVESNEENLESFDDRNSNIDEKIVKKSKRGRPKGRKTKPIGERKPRRPKSDKTKSYECYICRGVRRGTTFKRLGALETHMHYHTNILLSCKECSKTFGTKIAYDRHVAKHANRYKFLCNICAKKFSHSGHLTLHLKQHEVGKQCLFCDTKFDTKIELHKHMRNEHLMQAKYLCTICTIVFPTREEYGEHLKMHKESGEFLCELCPKRFATSFTLKNHVKQVHLQIRRYTCSYCSYKALYKKEITLHERSHNGERPYACGVCRKRFSRSKYTTFLQYYTFSYFFVKFLSFFDFQVIH